MKNLLFLGVAILKHFTVYCSMIFLPHVMFSYICRYEWSGTPLYVKELPVAECPTRCCHCDGETVFEFQLMPALVNYLKAAETTGLAKIYLIYLALRRKLSSSKVNSNI